MKRMVIALAGLLLTAGQLYAGNGDLIVDGKVGVGTTIPADKLEVNKIGAGSLVWPIVVSNSDNNAANPSGTAAGIKFRMSDPVDGSFKWVGIAGVSESSYANWVGLGFFTGTTGQQERMRITNSGDVGIGTITPTTKLNVYKNQYNATDIIVYVQGGALHVNGEANDSMGDRSGRIYFGKRNYAASQFLGWTATGDNAGYYEFGTGNLTVNGTVTASNGLLGPSDIKYKKNVLHIDDALGKLLKLDGHSYEWKTDEYKDKGFQEGRHYGVIAQEIETVLPEVVNTASDGTKAVAYTEIIPVLIEAIKEQQALILEQREQIAHQQEEIREVKLMIDGGI